ncbi:cellulose binding domain-containing protein [Glycomyces salinus]|uniref:cellulose binding domain-containing protein n=1 Tax=Glycomyces salinus TaxID=980294 RepID=UPI0018ED31CB|nr:cellulose binding domain-containing protein [Glycomyces salinus]
MRPPRFLLRGGLAIAAGLLLSGALAAPASADHPEPPPRPFQAEDAGEDGCTIFETGGEALWRATHPGEDHRVEISGEARVVQTPGAPGYCLPVIPADRQIEFTAYAGGAAVAEHIEPIDAAASPGQYQFDFSGATAFDRLTVAVCQERREDGSSWEGRCGDEVTVRPDGGADEAQPYFHEFEVPDACHRATVDATLQWIDPRRVRVEGTAVLELIAPEYPCDPIEPAGEYRVLFTANHHDSVVEETEVSYEPVETAEEFSRLLPSDPDADIDVHYVVAKVCAFDHEGAMTGCLEDSIRTIEPQAEQERYCEYTFAVTADWGNGYMGSVAITPLVEPLHHWTVVITLPDGRVIQSVWNAEWTQNGSVAELTNTSWNGPVPVGGTVEVGFIVSGSSDPAPLIEVYGNGRACEPAL